MSGEGGVTTANALVLCKEIPGSWTSGWKRLLPFSSSVAVSLAWTASIYIYITDVGRENRLGKTDTDQFRCSDYVKVL